MAHYLAQINISRLLAPLDDPKIAAFVAQLEPINALADKAPGFVWRLKSESGNATDIAYNDDPFVIVNMSVWESIEALRGFAYRSRERIPRSCQVVRKDGQAQLLSLVDPSRSPPHGRRGPRAAGTLPGTWRNPALFLVFPALPPARG